MNTQLRIFLPKGSSSNQQPKAPLPLTVSCSSLSRNPPHSSLIPAESLHASLKQPSLQAISQKNHRNLTLSHSNQPRAFSFFSYPSPLKISAASLKATTSLCSLPLSSRKIVSLPQLKLQDSRISHSRPWHPPLLSNLSLSLFCNPPPGNSPLSLKKNSPR